MWIKNQFTHKSCEIYLYHKLYGVTWITKKYCVDRDNIMDIMQQNDRRFNCQGTRFVAVLILNMRMGETQFLKTIF